MFVRSQFKHAVGVAALIFGSTAFAQQTQIPPEHLQQIVRYAGLSNSDPASPSLPASTPVASSSAAPAVLAPTTSPSSADGLAAGTVGHHFRAIDAKFIFLNGMHLGLALADIELSQRCINQHSCIEANPLMPSSQGGKLGVGLGIFAYTSGTSYYLKKHNSKWWWLPPVSGVAIHAIGIASAMSH